MNEILENVLDQYRQIARVSEDIEQAFLARNMNAIPSLCAVMDELQEQAKKNDSLLLNVLQHEEIQQQTAMIELRDIIQAIQHRNQRLLPQIRGVMAVQQHELQTLKKGATALKGYKLPPKSGYRISSTN